VTRLLIFHSGLPTTPNTVEFQGKVVTVGAFPIGIDPEKFEEGLKKPKVVERIQTLEKKFQGVKLIVGVDRLDYIKGVPQKLHALEVFLTEHPEWIGKVVLVQVAVPSRQDVEEYQNLRAVVNELVGRINGKFGKYLEGAVIDNQLTSNRHHRIHAHPLHAQVGLLRRADCTLRCQ
jgi:trehalose 6-phosphate synthase